MRRCFLILVFFTSSQLIFSENILNIYENRKEKWLENALLERFLGNKKGAIHFFESADFKENPTFSEEMNELFYFDEFLRNPKRNGSKRLYFTSPSFLPLYFYFFTPESYIRGDKKALRHLAKFSESFPETPYGMVADFLLGWHEFHGSNRKKSEIKALEYFNRALAACEKYRELSGKWRKFSERVHFEKACLEWQEAKRCDEGVKKKVFSNYAEESLIDLMKIATENPSLRARGLLLLADLLIEKNDPKKALSLIQAEKDTLDGKSAQLVILFCKKLGEIYLALGENEKALEVFEEAEKSPPGISALSSEEKLDFLIAKSQVFSKMGKREKAISLLSVAVNDPSVSQLRLKAQFLRGEELFQMGKTPFAKKQWEALLKKGGPWAAEAQKRLIDMEQKVD